MTNQPARPRTALDPVAALAALGARWSPDFDAYASGQLPISQVRCVLCGRAPCACQHCTAIYVPYFGGAESVCGMTLRNGECPRGGTGADHGRKRGQS
jgi:hypothetical protein